MFTSCLSSLTTEPVPQYINKYPSCSTCIGMLESTFRCLYIWAIRTEECHRSLFDSLFYNKGSIDHLIGLKSTWLTFTVMWQIFCVGPGLQPQLWWRTPPTPAFSIPSITPWCEHNINNKLLTTSPKVNCFYSTNWHFISSVFLKNLVRFPLNLYCQTVGTLKGIYRKEAQSFLLLSSFLNSSYPSSVYRDSENGFSPSLSVFPLSVKVLLARLSAQPKRQGWTQIKRQQKIPGALPFHCSMVGTFPDGSH